MSNLGIETIHKVSGSVAVSDGNGGTVDVEYIANLSDYEDTCDLEQPSGMNDDQWCGMSDKIIDACYADAYAQINDAVCAESEQARIRADRVNSNSPILARLYHLTAAASRVVKAWTAGDLAGAVRLLDTARARACRVLRADFRRITRPEVYDREFQVEYTDPPLVEPVRLDSKHLGSEHPDNPIDRIARDLDCSVGEAYNLLRSVFSGESETDWLASEAPARAKTL